MARTDLYTKEYVDSINKGGISIGGSSPGRVQEEYDRAVASGVNPSMIKTDIKPIVQPSGEITRPIGDYPETQLTGGGKFTGTGIMPITSQVIAPASDLSKQITTPATTPAYDISKLGGYAMTPEEATGGAGGIKAYQERTSKLYAPQTAQTGFTKTAEESKAQILSERIQAIQDQLAGKPTYQEEQETAYGVPEKQAAMRDLEAQINVLKNEAAAIPLQAAGVNVTAGMLGAKQAEQQRQTAVRALTLNSLYETMRGNLLNAQAMADRAVEQKYAPLEAESEAKTANYNLILKSPDYTLAEKKRAEILQIAEEKRKADIALNKSNFEDILNLTRDAVKDGFTDLVALNKAQKAVDEKGNPSIIKAQEILARGGAFKAKADTIKPPISGTGANYNTRLNAEISAVYSGKYGIEGAREKAMNILKKEFPSVDVAKDIYNRLPDGYDKQIKPEGRMTASNLDQQAMTDLISDIGGGATLQQLYMAYPEVSPALIQSLYYNQ